MGLVVQIEFRHAKMWYSAIHTGSFSVSVSLDPLDLRCGAKCGHLFKDSFRVCVGNNVRFAHGWDTGPRGTYASPDITVTF